MSHLLPNLPDIFRLEPNSRRLHFASSLGKNRRQQDRILATGTCCACYCAENITCIFMYWGRNSARAIPRFRRAQTAAFGLIWHGTSSVKIYPCVPKAQRELYLPGKQLELTTALRIACLFLNRKGNLCWQVCHVSFQGISSAFSITQFL